MGWFKKGRQLDASRLQQTAPITASSLEGGRSIRFRGSYWTGFGGVGFWVVSHPPTQARHDDFPLPIQTVHTAGAGGVGQGCLDTALLTPFAFPVWGVGVGCRRFPLTGFP